MEVNGKKAFLKLYFSFVFPSLCIGGLLVFLLNINDYGIASVFGVNVFALELYSRFSAGNSVYSVFLSGLPLFFLCMALMALFGFYISQGNFPFSAMKGKNPFKKDKFLKIPAVLGLFVLGLFVLVPLLNLWYEVLRVKEVLVILSDSANEIGYSLFISALTALLCFIPALLFAYFFYKSKLRIWFLALAALSFVIPSPIGGLSVIEMWNTPLLGFIYSSPIMPALALTARFAFIEAVILSVAISKVDKALLENMTLHYPGFFGFFKCMAHLIWKEAFAGILIVFALSVGEFGITLLVTPPGYQMLTIKIYNYLHYGASEIVAVLCFGMLVFVLLIAFALFLLLNGEKDE
jgi:iron(III) transport system permease protein